MANIPGSTSPLHVIESEIERSAEHILTEYLVDSCEKMIEEEAEGRLLIGYSIRRGNDFIIIRMAYVPNEEKKYTATDKRWTLDIDNKIIGDDYLELEDALDAAGIFKRT